MNYQLFRAGRIGIERIGFYELWRFLEDGSPPIGEAHVAVHHYHHGAKPPRRR